MIQLEWSHNTTGKWENAKINEINLLTYKMEKSILDWSSFVLLKIIEF